MRRVITLLSILLLVVLLGIGAILVVPILSHTGFIQQAQAAGVINSITPSTPTIGDTVTIQGSGFGSRLKGRITIANKLVTNVYTDDSGAFTQTLTIPSWLPLGTNTVIASTSSTSASSSITINSPSGSVQPNGGPGGAWNIIFDDEFNTSSLNTTIWTPNWFSTSLGCSANPTDTANYATSNVSQPGDGYLHLDITSGISTCGGNTKQYLGALASTNPSDGISGHTGFAYTYGYIEFRAYLPASGSAIANWPATWTTGQPVWPANGENDTMEGLFGGQACYHFHSPSGHPGACASGNYSGWHIFASDWEPGSVTYYYDGVQVGQISTGITSSPHYIILDYTTTTNMLVVPATMLVDYVRLWQKVTPTPTPTLSGTITSISPSSGAVGTSITVSGTGFDRSATGKLTINNNVVTNFHTDSNGAFSQSFRVPSWVTSGMKTLGARTSNTSTSTSFTVL